MNATPGPLLAFDTETTGVDICRDRIVTAALILRDGARETVWSWVLDPGVPIPAEASAIHGITTSFAMSVGEQPVPALDRIAGLIAHLLSQGVPLVAFNASFDIGILEAELTRYGLPTLAERLGGKVRPVLDPLVLDRAWDRYRPGKRRLGDLCALYGVRVGTLHAADVDARATLDLLDALRQRFKDLSDNSLSALHDFQVDAHRQWVESFNAYKASQGRPWKSATTVWP